MARFQNFRRRARRGYNRASRSVGRRYSGVRRFNSQKTLGMKNSSLIKIAVVGGLLYFLRDKIKPFLSSLTGKK